MTIRFVFEANITMPLHETALAIQKGNQNVLPLHHRNVVAVNLVINRVLIHGENNFDFKV